jgi:heat shock protein HslJ
MTDLRARFRALDELEPPDILARSRSLMPGTTQAEDFGLPRRRLATVGVALIAAAAVGVTLFALRGLGGSGRMPLSPGEIVRYDVAGAPQPLAFGQGAAWVSVSHTSSKGTGPATLQRIDGATGAVTDASGTNGVVWPAAGGEGVWATCNQLACGGPGVVQLDPATGAVLRTIPVSGRLSQITTGLGSVWVTTDDGTSGTVTRIDPAGGRVVSSYPGHNYDLIGVGGGSVWVTRSEGPTGVVQLDPDTGKVLSTYAFPDACTLDVTDTQVFIASCDGGMHAGTGHDELAALDARTGALLYRMPLDMYGQMRVTDGILWLAGSTPDGTSIRLERFDPTTGRSLGQAISIPRGPLQKYGVSLGLFPPHVFFDVGAGSLWLTDFSAYEVIRVVLPFKGTGSPTPPPTVGSSPVPPPLAGTRWTAVDLDPGSAASSIPVVHGHAPWVVFGADGHAGGDSGCNTFGARYTLGADGALTMDHLASTLVGCTGAIDAQERAFTEELLAATSYRIDGWRLTLLRRGSAVLILQAAPRSRRSVPMPTATISGSPSTVAYPFAPSQVAFWNTSVGLTAGDEMCGSCDIVPGGIVQLTRDGGHTWTTVLRGSPVLGLATYGTADAWVTTRTGVWRTSDAGRSWSKVSNATLVDPTFSSPTQGWAAVPINEMNARPVETTDGGASWTPIPSPCGGSVSGLPRSELSAKVPWLRSLSQTGSAQGIALCTNGGTMGGVAQGIFATTDDGQTWTQVWAGYDTLAGMQVTPTGFGARWSDPQNTFDTTEDGGKTWTRAGTLPDEAAYSVWLLSDKEAVAITSAGGPYHLAVTDDGGSTWSVVATYPRS